MSKNIRNAVIYCRVSDTKQKTLGHGLDSQEHRCRQYALANGMHVEKVFPDDASGGGDFMNRPGMVSLLSYLDQHPETNYVVLFDDLKRFSRDREFHFKLRQEFRARNAEVECLNYRFDDTPEGEFMETIFAAQGQLERLQNRRQVIQKMRARVEQGYAVFQSPIGLKFQKTKGQGKMLVHDEPFASIVKEALEGYAKGRFQIQAEVKRFLESHPLYPKNKHGEVSNEQVHRLLRQPVYAGYVEAPVWNISLRKGKHEGLISYATFQKIQERLDGNPKTAARKDISEDFPLRGFVVCGDCNHPLTACWSTSTTGKKHPYYLCHNKPCKSNRKSIRRDALESDFEEVLGTLLPTKGLHGLIQDLFKKAWEEQLNKASSLADNVQQSLIETDKQIEQLLDRIVETTSISVIKSYERRIDQLEKKKLSMREKLEISHTPRHTFEEMFEFAITFVSNPQKLWRSNRLEHKRAVMKLAFLERPAYHRKNGFSNYKISLPFKALGGFLGDKKKMVIAERFELSTY